MEIPRGRGRGVIKITPGTEIPKGWGHNIKTLHGVWIFSGTTQCGGGEKIKREIPKYIKIFSVVQ